MKKCPYCNEEIQDIAKKCRYCGEDIKPKSRMIHIGVVIGILISVFLIGGIVYFVFYSKDSINNPNFNQSSKEYAIMGRQVWSAFECSALASTSDNQKEAERLFMFGYGQGKKFIGALWAKKIKQEDMSQETPWIVLTLLQGPDEGFILGKIYSVAEEEALKDVFKTINESNSDGVLKQLANNKYIDSNCSIIGK